MTFSIVGFDPNTGDLGVAVQSKFISVGAIVPWAKANIGAVATQAHVNTSYGPNGLELLTKGLSAKDVIEKLTLNDDMKSQRQVGVIDAKGVAEAYTGKDCLYWAGHIIGNNFACQGNILINEDTVDSMALAFESSKGDLSEKLLSALSAADQEGRGDVRGKQSSSLLVVREKGGYGEYTDHLVNIRVDEHQNPIKELKRIFQIYDMIFLSREDESNLFQIDGEISKNIRSTLLQLGYLRDDQIDKSNSWSNTENAALELWFGVNNFENKWHSDSKIWKSVYDYLIAEKGTPKVTIKRMSDL
ncbi:MAG: DUF1028 domain-containing protein [Candidatus Hodarchaeales archaeon]|jgi:uncharacterized Ntn-hydrolase superfamily protein